MKTTVNLKNIAKVAVAALALFMISPVNAGTPDDPNKFDNAGPEVKEAWMNISGYTADIEKELVYEVPVEGMNRPAELSELYAVVDAISRNIESSLVYGVPEYTVEAAWLNTLRDITENMTNTLKYEYVVEAPFAYHFDIGLAHEVVSAGVSKLEENTEFTLQAEHVFEYNYDVALAEEDLERETVQLSNWLVYDVPVSGEQFDYDFEYTSATRPVLFTTFSF